jgi:hypothetical protein
MTDSDLTIEEIIGRIKYKLQEYWVNEVRLPLKIQLKSMAIMDMVVDELVHEK